MKNLIKIQDPTPGNTSDGFIPEAVVFSIPQAAVWVQRSLPNYHPFTDPTGVEPTVVNSTGESPSSSSVYESFKGLQAVRGKNKMKNNNTRNLAELGSQRKTAIN